MNQASSTPPRPLAALPELPDDLEQAFEALKLAILRHQYAHWREANADHMIDRLCRLVQLSLSASPCLRGEKSPAEGGR